MLVIDSTEFTPSRVRDVYQVAQQAIWMTPISLCHREYTQLEAVETASILIHVISKR